MMTVHIPAWRYGLAYALWLVSIAASLPCAALIRETFHLLIGRGQWDRYGVRAIDEFLILGLGIGLLIVVIACESYYRTGVRRNQLWSRFLQVTALQLALLGGLHTFQFVLELADGVTRWSRLILIACELGGAAVCWWWRRGKS
jgi:hypothetical protein